MIWDQICSLILIYTNGPLHHSGSENELQFCVADICIHFKAMLHSQISVKGFQPK